MGDRPAAAPVSDTDLCACDDCAKPAALWAATSFVRSDGERLALISVAGCCVAHRDEFMCYAYEQLTNGIDALERLISLGFGNAKIEVLCVNKAEALAITEAALAWRAN